MRALVVIATLISAAAAQYSDPASHGFTINAPGQTSTATFGYGAGGSSVRQQNVAVREAAPTYRAAAPSYRAVAQPAAVNVNAGRSIGYTRRVVRPETRLTIGSDGRSTIAAVPYGRNAGYAAANTGYAGRSAGYQNAFANPTIMKQPARFQYQPPQSKGNVAPSHGYTVNAPGFTKHKSFAGPAVHGANQAFYHASG